MAKDNPPPAFFTKAVNVDVDLLAMHDAWPTRYPFLLESADGHADISRYDLLFFAADEHLLLDQTGSIAGNVTCIDKRAGFLDNLDVWKNNVHAVQDYCALPFTGGWFVYLGYELVAEIEPCLKLPSAPGYLPTALAVRCPAAIIRDNHESKLWLVAESETLLTTLLDDITAVPADSGLVTEPAQVNHMQEGSPEAFTYAVERIKDYILAGDVFQVNLSRSWKGKIDADTTDAELYKQLREANAAPFAGLMRWQETTLFSSSPERLVEVRGHEVQTRPIAGTRPRSRVDDADAVERSDLVTHPKERAEHIMLIDLERNDLGRICKPGSVEVNELMVLESYTHVHHIVSNVRGVLREGISGGDVIRAVFPGGTITGCPKVRCMEIIAELEGEGRSYYTGAMGYLDRRGNMDLNILIRCIERSGESIGFRTGAGIVADSIPDNELHETRAKARGLLRALNVENH